ncbi:GNAT family N-acetyltransferase [Halobacillus locisalis]|uniref:GNAT family N-acetyltransferase n=1 Tax=Halobacillus locisalis TaxID=220753 RepID=A0A838CW77_9BACI|nr:GNAT family N-acetyltransferase [Halobacillus locisalis]MBA2176173.1 GNAT family N-acetyltransferase [Halobacillus locisalis]
MFQFVPVSEDLIQIEKSIHNKNPDYNNIAYDKNHLNENDIRGHWRDAEKLGLERYLVKKGDIFISIVEYGMSSPNQNKPWLSLLLLDQDFHGHGIGREIYHFYEELMTDKQVDTIEIAVHAANTKTLTFWTSLGVQVFNERAYEGKLMYSLSKQLSDTY